jgi:hypothetical protein
MGNKKYRGADLRIHEYTSCHLVPDDQSALPDASRVDSSAKFLASDNPPGMTTPTTNGTEDATPQQTGPNNPIVF